jgi:uncharacterized integral membrane protein
MKYKLISGIVLFFIIVIFIIQNAATVEIHLIFWTVSISRVLLMLIILLFGIIIGWILNSYIRHVKAED